MFISHDVGILLYRRKPDSAYSLPYSSLVRSLPLTLTPRPQQAPDSCGESFCGRRFATSPAKVNLLLRDVALLFRSLRLLPEGLHCTALVIFRLKAKKGLRRSRFMAGRARFLGLLIRYSPDMGLVAVFAFHAAVLDVKLVLSNGHDILMAGDTVAPVRPRGLVRLMAFIAVELHGRLAVNDDLGRLADGRLFRREVFETIGGWTEGSNGTARDYEWFSRAARNGFVFANLQEVLLDYRLHGQSVKTTRLKETLTTTLEVKREYWASEMTMRDRLTYFAEKALLHVPDRIVLSLFLLTRARGRA